MLRLASGALRSASVEHRHTVSYSWFRRHKCIKQIERAGKMGNHETGVRRVPGHCHRQLARLVIRAKLSPAQEAQLLELMGQRIVEIGRSQDRQMVAIVCRLCGTTWFCRPSGWMTITASNTLKNWLRITLPRMDCCERTTAACNSRRGKLDWINKCAIGNGIEAPKERIAQLNRFADPPYPRSRKKTGC